MKIKSAGRLVRRIALAYLSYIVVFGALIFLIRPRNEIEISTDTYFSDSKSQDKVALVEGRYESYLARIYMIESAEESIDMAYYTLHDGETTRAILASLLEAADRGVEVRLLLDGIFHNLKRDLKDTIYSFNQHPNIDLRFYEDLKPLQPWTFNNRLHDKFIIIDEESFILGGRNIGDKYFLEDYKESRQVNDRDVFVAREDFKTKSSVDDLGAYFERLWTSDYSKNPVKKMSPREEERARVMKEDLLAYYGRQKEENRELGEEPASLKRRFESNKVSLVHNPIERGNKYPLVLNSLAQLASRSDRVILQSPYVIPTRLMRDMTSQYDIDYENISLYTNSRYSSPNLFAMAGYGKHRKRIVDSGIRLHEYQGPGSIHAKSYIYDDRLAVVGSFNMDNRSSFLSTETMVLIDSEDFSQHLLKEFDIIGDRSFELDENYEYINRGEEVKKPAFIKMLLIRILSVFTYFFDYML